MTDEQRFFDLRGWMLLPGILSRREIEAIKRVVEHLLAATGDARAQEHAIR